jgi:hypothetical protein
MELKQPAQEPVADVIQESITIDDFIKMQDFTVSEKATQPTITWPAGHGILVGNGFKFLAFKKMEVKEGVQLSIVGDSELHFTVKEPEQPAQEPVAFTNADELQELKDGMTTCYMYKERLNDDCIPLYTKEQL